MTLARFTPSLLDGDTLERLFVHRHGMLDDVMARVAAASAGHERRHKLFVGPRGAGKTHLISLLHHRVDQARAGGLNVGLSWLLEDPWEIETYDDLLGQILEQLNGAPATGSVERALLAAAADAPIVVLVENLDRILTAIGSDGQRRLRALLENERPLLIIATSTRLSEDLLSQAEPFYGFFDTTQLEPFTVEQAADMLTEIAEYSDNRSLASLLHTPEGRARLATIAHLAGGQPRVWALLGTGLTTGGIDDMIDMLMVRFDDLTPYYQEQLARLSPNEAKVVRRLADADRPLTVRDMATLTKIDQKSVAKTVSDLRKRGWIRQHRSILTEKVDGRLRYYDLAEPLARIAFQVKAARGQPIRLIVDFLAIWYDLEQLSSSPDTGGVASAYRALAIGTHSQSLLLRRFLAEGRETAVLSVSEEPQPELVDLLESVDNALAAYVAGNPEPVLAQPAMISRLIEHRLSTTTPVELRVAIGHLAIATGGAVAWRRRVDDILSQANDAERARSLVLAVQVEANAGCDDAAVDLLIHKLAEAVDALGDGSIVDQFTGDTSRIAMQLALTDRPLAAARLVEVMRTIPSVWWAEPFLVFIAAVIDVMAGRVHKALDDFGAYVGGLGDAAGADPIGLYGLKYLAYLYSVTGDPAREAVILADVLNGQVRLVGADDSSTLLTRVELADAHGRAGEPERAVEELSAVLPDVERTLGPDAPETEVARERLDFWTAPLSERDGRV